MSAAARRVAAVLALSTTSAHATTVEVDCEPAHPVFCMNIHAGCAGRTEHETFRFKLRATDARGSIESTTRSSDIPQHYRDARAEWGGEDTRLILWPDGRPGYLRLLVDGRYVFRHYVGPTGVMSYGECR